MPYRNLDVFAKIQFSTSARMPSLIYKACIKTETVSNTAYIQRAVCEALSRDLGIPLEDLVSELPPSRSRAATLFGGDRKPRRHLAGPSNTVEEVR